MFECRAILRIHFEFGVFETDAFYVEHDIAGRGAPEMLKLFHAKDLPRTPFKITATPEAR